MSTNLKNDPELMRLRSELLNGLNKKQPSNTTKCLSENQNEQKKANFDDNDDDELKKLRLEALNAKRSSSNTKRKTELPGRFRYDTKENSDDEEDDDDDDDEFNDYKLLNSFNSSSKEELPDNEVLDDVHHETNGDLTCSQSTNGGGVGGKQPPALMSFRNNYEAYRFECSKLIANVAYEPNSLSNQVNISCDDFDLRKFLRDKALKQESNYQKYEIREDSSENKTSTTTRLHLNDIEYVYEPITRPITIENDTFFRNNQFNNMRNFVPKKQRSEQEMSALNNKLPNDNNYNDDEEDDTDLRTKRLKSIVITKNPASANSNLSAKETVNNQSSSSSSSSWQQPRSRNYYSSSSSSSSSNHNYHRKRKKSNSSTNSR